MAQRRGVGDHAEHDLVAETDQPPDPAILDKRGAAHRAVANARSPVASLPIDPSSIALAPTAASGQPITMFGR